MQPEEIGETKTNINGENGYKKDEDVPEEVTLKKPSL